MSTIKGKDKKEKKPRTAAQLAATARLVKLNKERAVLRSEGKLPPVQRKKKTKAIIKESPVDPPALDLDDASSVSSVSTLSSDDDEYNYHFDDSAKDSDPEPNYTPEPEPEPVKPVKPKRKRRVYK
tara:strand:- start:659 stop:1036 length:378 start_codon:yes stop_codon:yes gene_type:complete